MYYYLWIWAVPRWRGYRIRQETLVLEDGAVSHNLVKVPVAEIAEWDATHDAVGRPLEGISGSELEQNAENEKIGGVVRTGDLEK